MMVGGCDVMCDAWIGRMKDVPSERRKKKQMNETTAVVASSYCKSLERATSSINRNINEV